MPKKAKEEDPPKTDLRTTFPPRLRVAMEKSRTKGVDLAKRVGVEPQVVTDWRKGRSLPGAENLVLIAATVNESVSWLIGDALHGLDTIERASNELGIRLGGERLKKLRDVPDERLLPVIDAIVAPSEPAKQPDRKSRPRGRRLN